MNYEQKYKQALSRATFYSGELLTENQRKMLLDIFPELSESEDERTRKELIEEIAFITPNNDELDDECNVLPTYQKRIDKYRAWLGKQGEQPTDKVEPKFKAGDWIIDEETPNDVFYVIGVLEEIYKVIDIDGQDYHIPHCKADKQFHLWSIDDAKDGDVLETDGSVFIYAKVLYNKPYAYCGVDKYGVFKDNCLENNWSNSVYNIHPATDKQRDQLEKAIMKAGYEWDSEKKELKKIEVASKESDDERIKREIVDCINAYANLKDEKIPTEWLDWLEKQGNKIVDCQQNHQDVKYPNGGIVMEDFNGGEGFYKLHLDYLSKKQVKEVEEMVRTWNKEPKTSNENIKNCVEMCLTDANEQRFEDFGTTLKDCLAWIEKQGEQPTDKIEPKLHEGDWIVINEITYQITEIDNSHVVLSLNGRECNFRLNILNLNNAHLWSINDAKDGDVLAINWHEDDDSWEKIIIFKKYHNKGVKGLYSMPCVEGYGNTFKNGKLAFQEEIPYYSETWTANLHPATKEQRDLLFSKMKEAGYEWNAEKKELKKIEATSKKSEDEKIREALVKQFSDYDAEETFYCVKNKDILAWLEKQGKQLDPDKVIGWLVANICDFEYYVKLFKQDFGL